MWFESQGKSEEINNNPNIIESLLAEIQNLRDQIDELKLGVAWKNKKRKNEEWYMENEALYAKISYKHPWDGDHFTTEEKIKYDVVWDWHGTIIPLSPKEWNDTEKLRDAISYMEKNQEDLNRMQQFPWWAASAAFANRRLEHNTDDLIAYKARLAELEWQA